ncbi:DNA translocase FtsK [Treponema sp. OMZ 805]|uniref:DNA translocase FtsK n=1 Tax=Treponema sp. OMZ 805 TaxID=2726068 RepID=UPI003D8CA5D1
MGNRDSRFRVLALILSVLFFCAGIVLTLGIFLPITGFASSNYALFAMGQRVFSVYGFSSFLIPLLFLYGAVLLLIPGWSRESKAVLLGVPLYFVTAIIGERLITVFAPSVSIPTLRQFVTISILICALLLVCFEIFLMLTLSEKLSGRHFFVRNISEKEQVPKNDEANDSDTGEEPIFPAPAVEAAAPEVEQAPDSPETEQASAASTASSVPPEKTSDGTLESTATDSVEVPVLPAKAPDKAAIPPEEAEDELSTSPVSIDMTDTDTVYRVPNVPEEDTIIVVPVEEHPIESPAADTIEPTDTNIEEIPLLEEVEEDVQPLPLSTPLSAVMDMQEKEAVRPVFDPSDPNNLFASLEEITAPVERLKQTDHSETQLNPPLPKEDTAPTPSVENAPAMTESSEAPTPLKNETATAEEDATAVPQMDIIPEETTPEHQTIAAASPQAEPEIPLVFVNGVPLPNERSDILDTMEVIDSEKTEAADIQNTAVTDADIKTAGVQEATAADIGTETQESDSTIDMANARIGDDVAETDIGAEADIAIDSFDAQDEETADDGEAEQETEEEPEPNSDGGESEADEELDSNADEAFLKTIEQTVPIIPAKPAPPPPPRKKYAIPFDLLTNYPDGEYWVVDDATRRSALMLKSTFNEFKIDVSITGIRKGPVVTMFEMLPSPGIKLSKITNLQDNIALRLAASSVRIVAPIPGKHAVGIEVPNKKRSIVSFRELIETDLPEAAKMAIPVALGKDVTGNPQVLDLAQTPHLLIAGATGSGKSVCVNSIILSILYNRRPDEVKLILVDPKIVELKLYNDIAHLLTPVITEPKRAFQALQYALCEMERRYALLDNMGVRDIKTFNAKIKSERIATETLPYIVIIIDEFADLMATSGKELEATVARLCAMSRAVGIHLVLATQRPSIDVITGLIKANIPSRIAFMVASKTDSRIILDEMGAEKLLGKGDMLYVSAARPFPTRMQGAFVSEQEVERVVACVKEYCEPEYIDEEIFVDDDDEPYDNAVFSDDNDPLYDQALEIVAFAGKASASYVQRKLKIGYNRAARLIEEMEARGIVGPANGSKPREIIRHV